MSNTVLQSKIDKAIECFKSNGAVGLTISELSIFTNANPSAFESDCQFYFLPNSLKALEAGKLQIEFVGREGKQKHKPISISQQPIKNFQAYIGAKQGYILLTCKGENLCLYLGENSRLGKPSSKAFAIKLSDKSSVFIGDNTTGGTAAIYAKNCHIKLGNDCMLSSDITIQGTDGHGIVDVAKGEIINNTYNFVDIGDHVWLSRKVTILPRAKIGTGSLIGAGSIVTKEIDSMSIAAGVPAKIIKKGFTWSRSIRKIDDVAARLISDYNQSNLSF